jgi:hypothetical protein
MEPMGDRLPFNAESLSPDLQDLAQRIEAIAAERRGNEIALLELLRLLEQVHSQIREGWFQETLPTNRQRLYALLKDIETKGGWPYIKRMPLRYLLDHLAEIDPSSSEGPYP